MEERKSNEEWEDYCERKWQQRVKKAEWCLLSGSIISLSAAFLLYYVNGLFGLMLFIGIPLLLISPYLADPYTYGGPGSRNTGETVSG